MYKRIITSLILALVVCNDKMAVSASSHNSTLRPAIYRFYYHISSSFCNIDYFTNLINWKCEVNASGRVILTSSTITFINEDGTFIKQDMNEPFSEKINSIAQIGIEQFENGEYRFVKFVQVLSKDVVLY